MLPRRIVCGVRAGVTLTVPLPASGVKGQDRAYARRIYKRPSPAPPCGGRCQSSPTRQSPHTGSKEEGMITETQPHMIVLQLTDTLLAQLQPYLEELDITTTPHIESADRAISTYSHVACDASIGQHTQQLTMHGEVYAALVTRVGSALDYDIRWQPNEYEPDGFVERVHPLELTGTTHVPVDCSACGAPMLDNRAALICACGQAIPLI
jgi:hypothetical protein